MKSGGAYMEIPVIMGNISLCSFFSNESMVISTKAVGHFRIGVRGDEMQFAGSTFSAEFHVDKPN